MDRIRYFADISIRRACGFGFLALATASVGLYWDILAMVKLAATGVTFMAAFLAWKAFEATSRNYRHTEVFELMDRKHDFPEARVQQVFGSVMRERYLWHATAIGITAFVLWLLCFLLLVIRA